MLDVQFRHLRSAVTYLGLGLRGFHSSEGLFNSNLRGYLRSGTTKYRKQKADRTTKDGVAKQPSRLLKYDPNAQIADFTTFGVFPFLQKKLNDFLLPETQKTNAIPDFNASPTPDQKRILSVLKSGHNLLINGGFQTGKSIAMLTYCIEQTLSTTPAFDHHNRPDRVQSLIIVPTDELVNRYATYTRYLLKDIPPNCCPKRLVASSSSQRKTVYTLERGPMNLAFLSHDSKPQFYSTNVDSHNVGVPNIVVTTAALLEKAIQGQLNLEPSALQDLKFIGVDELDIFLLTTSIGEWDVVVQEGNKNKYVNKIEKMIQKLKSDLISCYSDSLTNDLERVEKKHYFKMSSESSFNYSEIVINNRIDDVKSFIANEFKGTSKPDLSLLKKLIKLKRKNLYKPIQYCFLNSAKSNQAYNFGNLPSLSKPEDNDLLISFVDKALRLTNSQKKWKENERRLFQVENFSIPNNAILDNSGKTVFGGIINAYILNSSKSKVKDVQLENEVRDDLSFGDWKNLEKTYLRLKLKQISALNEDNYVSVVYETLCIAKKLGITKPFLIMIPEGVDNSMVAASLQQFGNIGKISCLSSGTVHEESHVIAHPSQLLGNTIPCVSNILVVGIESLLPEFALGKKATCTTKDNIPGLVDPVSDLSIFYLSRLLSSPSSVPKNLIFAISNWNLDPQDIQVTNDLNKLSRSMAFNGLLNHVRLKKTSSN